MTLDMRPAQAVWAVHLGRCVLASLFVLGGVDKLGDSAGALAQMEAAGLPFAPLALPVVIALELGGGLWVASGLRGAGRMALLLAAYTLVVNVVMHAFWAVPPAMARIELSLFFKNVAVAGGLIMLAGVLRLRRVP